MFVTKMERFPLRSDVGEHFPRSDDVNKQNACLSLENSEWFRDVACKKIVRQMSPFCSPRQLRAIASPLIPRHR